MRAPTPVLAALAALAACSADPRPGAGWSPTAEADLDAARRAQLETALAARDALVGELVGTLTAELTDSGPAEAIAVCREAAPRIAGEVGAERGLRIGRTSWKLRNPANAPPDWAAPLVEERPQEQRLAAHDDGRLGALLPIHVAGACLTCHGAEESIPADVRDALAELYPDDRATGFAAGDLRGWFWVEVAAAD